MSTGTPPPAPAPAPAAAPQPGTRPRAASQPASQPPATQPSATPSPDAPPAADPTPLRNRLIISAALALPVIVLSAAPAWQFRFWQWIALVLAAPVLVWGAWPFHLAAGRLARRGAAGTDTLLSIGTLVTLGWSLYALLFGAAGEPGMTQPSHVTVGPSAGSDAIHLDAATGLTVIVLLAQHLLARSERRARAAGRLPPDAGAEVGFPADRASGVLVPIAIVLAVATPGFWLGAGAATATAGATAIAVLLVGCPCALDLAAPTAWLAGIRRGPRLGIAISSPQVLSATLEVDTVLLHRTGVVTTGAMTVHAVHAGHGVDADLALRLAGAVEQACAHPVATAITAAARAVAAGGLPDVAEFDSTPGLGVRGLVAEVDGDTVVAHAVLVGRPELLAEHDIALPADLAAARDRTEAGGHTAVAVAWDGVARAVLAVGDPVRPTSAAAVRGLVALGVTPMLLTGDNGAAARVLADQLGLPAAAVISEVPPEGTVAVIERLQADGHLVALVGHGIGIDTAAPAAADLALITGTGDGAPPPTLRCGDLLAVLDALRLARRTRRVLTESRLAASICTILALPAAALGLLTPTLAAAAVGLASLLVVASSLRLRRFRGTPVTQATSDGLLPGRV